MGLPRLVGTFTAMITLLRDIQLRSRILRHQRANVVVIPLIRVPGLPLSAKN